MILPQTIKYRLRSSGTLVIISFSVCFFVVFVFFCLVLRCSSLKAPQFGYIYPHMCSSCPISGIVCYLECRHGFQSNGGVNVLQCGKNGKWNQNVSSTLQCKGTSFLWLFRLFEAKQKMEQCCFSKIRCLGRSCSPLAMNLTECTSVQVVWCDSIKGSIFSYVVLQTLFLPYSWAALPIFAPVSTEIRRHR